MNKCGRVIHKYSSQDDKTWWEFTVNLIDWLDFPKL